MSAEIDDEYVFKIIVVGDSAVGKSSLIKRYADREFHPEYISTIGVDFHLASLRLDGKNVKLQLWDVSGMDRFRSITTSYYRGASGVLLVYDITDFESFRNHFSVATRYWKVCPTDVEILLVGNKSDLCSKADVSTKRQVPHDEAKDYAEREQLAFTETSAKNANNVEKAFLTLAQRLKNAQMAKVWASAKKKLKHNTNRHQALHW